MTPTAPVDTSVVIPASVRRAAEAANAIHAAAYKTDPPAAPEPVALTPAPEPVAQTPAPEPVAQTPAPQPVAQTPAPQPVAQEPQPDPADANVSPEQWQHRYLSMKGRFDQSQITIGSMQQQMAELGDEMVRLQNSMTRQPAPRPAAPAPPPRLLTDADVQTYGPELLDVISRAAREAVAPEIQNVAQQSRQVSQQLTRQGTAGLYQQLDEKVPNWKVINVDPRFKLWCRSHDVYSRQVRGKLLNEAFQAADAPRVIAFFEGFQNEEVATGNAPAPQQQPQTPAPRQAAVQLETLAAPGRAKPAGGDSPASAADKPVFTRTEIATFYANVRKGAYAGRDADKARDEAAIFSAQREGRVR